MSFGLQNHIVLSFLTKVLDVCWFFCSMGVKAQNPNYLHMVIKVHIDPFLGHLKQVVSGNILEYFIRPTVRARWRLTDEERHLAIARLGVGCNQSDVAVEMEVSQNVIRFS